MWFPSPQASCEGSCLIQQIASACSSGEWALFHEKTRDPHPYGYGHATVFHIALALHRKRIFLLSTFPTLPSQHSLSRAPRGKATWLPGLLTLLAHALRLHQRHLPQALLHICVVKRPPSLSGSSGACSPGFCLPLYVSLALGRCSTMNSLNK